MSPNRRDALKATGSALVACGLSLTTRELAAVDDSKRHSAPRAAGGLPHEWRAMRKFDVHNHVLESLHQPDGNWTRVENIIEAAERLGIEKLCCSRPISGGRLADIAEVRAVNDSVLARQPICQRAEDLWCRKIIGLSGQTLV